MHSALFHAWLCLKSFKRANRVVVVMRIVRLVCHKSISFLLFPRFFKKSTSDVGRIERKKSVFLVVIGCKLQFQLIHVQLLMILIALSTHLAAFNRAVPLMADIGLYIAIIEVYSELVVDIDRF